MEKLINFLKIIFLLIVIFLILFVFFDDIRSALGIAQTCSTPLCRNNAQLFRDVCANCHVAFENANNILGRLRGRFSR